MTGKELRADVLRLTGDLLVPLGWRPVRGKTSFARPLAPGIEARLYYNFVLYKQPLRANVTPYVEIIHRAVEDARKFITGRPLYTINKQLQSLMADATAHYRWVFIPEDGMELPADRLVLDSLEYAPPFYEQFRTLDDVTRGLEKMAKGKRTIMKESLAIAYCLQGRTQEAVAVLEDDINAMRSNPADIACAQLPKYAELFGLRFELCSGSSAEGGSYRSIGDGCWPGAARAGSNGVDP
jgi:hypothetical protein